MNSIFDIETAPNPEAASRLMPPFDPSEVKVGNLKPENAAAKIEEARKDHEKNWLEKAALRPETSTILAIGYWDSEKGVILNSIKNMDGEKDLIEDFWKRVGQWHKMTGRPLMTYNGDQFDLPMLVLRSRILGIHVPGNIRKGRYWNGEIFHDLRQDWLLGRKETEIKSSLDYVAKAFGLAGKNGSGRDFAQKFLADEIGAYQYLWNDLYVTKQVAEKLGHDFTGSTQTWEEWRAKYLESKSPEKEVF